jgi:hypothetical protein
MLQITFAQVYVFYDVLLSFHILLKTLDFSLLTLKWDFVDMDKYNCHRESCK